MQGECTVSVAGFDRVSPAISPTIEFGARYNVDQTTTLRPYFSVGVSVYANSTSTINATFLSGGAPIGGTSASVAQPTATGDAGIGFQLYRAKGLEVTAGFEVHVASDYLNQSASLRGAYRF
jgi:hypothetical protein